MVGSLAFFILLLNKVGWGGGLAVKKITLYHLFAPTIKVKGGIIGKSAASVHAKAKAKVFLWLCQYASTQIRSLQYDPLLIRYIPSYPPSFRPIFTFSQNHQNGQLPRKRIIYHEITLQYTMKRKLFTSSILLIQYKYIYIIQTLERIQCVPLRTHFYSQVHLRLFSIKWTLYNSDSDEINFFSCPQRANVTH